MHHNGPAIWGGCVTRRSIRLESWYFSSASWRITVRGEYGVVFAVQVQSLFSITRVAVQVGSESRIYHRLQSWLLALAQCRGTNYLGARNLSRCKEFYWVQLRVSGCNNLYKFVLSAGTKAKIVTNNLPILSVLAVRAFIISNTLKFSYNNDEEL